MTLSFFGRALRAASLGAALLALGACYYVPPPPPAAVAYAAPPAPGYYYAPGYYAPPVGINLGFGYRGGRRWR
jgi:hypothetical protein